MSGGVGRTAQLRRLFGAWTNVVVRFATRVRWTPSTRLSEFVRIVEAITTISDASRCLVCRLHHA